MKIKRDTRMFERHNSALPVRLPAILGCWLLSVVAALPQHQVFWGDVHGHTAFSDGKGTVDDFFTDARDRAKLDFVIVTDHDFGGASPWRMPEENWALTQKKAGGFTVNGRFVAIAGYEWTSQPKYWTDVGTDIVSERLFPGPPHFYNHKNVYFPEEVGQIFSAKDTAWHTPDLLAAEVRKHGGLIHNNHPDATPEGREQFDYSPASAAVIVNTEMLPDTMRFQGTNHSLQGEQLLCAFLNKGGRTGFVGGSDTHEGKSSARTAVLASELSRVAIFDALRHRRNYAITHARIVLDFRINGQLMGGEIEVKGHPHLLVDVKGTDRIEEVSVIRNGSMLRRLEPSGNTARLEFVDDSFAEAAWYYARVTQQDTDENGNRSQAWSSPIWVKGKR
jgi:hypothetical protein